MKKILVITVLMSLISGMAMAQNTAKKKYKVAVITFNENDKIEKTELPEELKQAMNSHSFKSQNLDTEISADADRMDEGAVYLQ